MIYVGVSHHVPSAEDQMLVLDIGGGSTELIIGEGYEPRYLESLFMGCVGLSARFFEDGRVSAKRFDRARLAARLELQPVIATFQSLGWKTAVGSSGTIRAAERVARGLGLIEGGLTVDALEALMHEVNRAGGVQNLDLPEFNPQRAPVFPGGLVILLEAMTSLGIDELQVSDGALREGLLYDMLGRIQRHDARDQTIGAMQLRFNVDRIQGAAGRSLGSWSAGSGSVRLGGLRIKPTPAPWPGPRGCMRWAWILPMPSTTSTRPTWSPTPICRGSIGSSSSSSPSS